MHVLCFFTEAHDLGVHALFFKIVYKFLRNVIISDDHHFAHEVFLVPEVVTDHKVDKSVDHEHNSHARQCNGYEYARKAELLEEIQVQHYNAQPSEINARCTAREHFET